MDRADKVDNVDNVDEGEGMVGWSEGFRKMTGAGGSWGEVFLVFVAFLVVLAFFLVLFLVCLAFFLASGGGDWKRIVVGVHSGVGGRVVWWRGGVERESWIEGGIR